MCNVCLASTVLVSKCKTTCQCPVRGASLHSSTLPRSITSGSSPHCHNRPSWTSTQVRGNRQLLRRYTHEHTRLYYTAPCATLHYPYTHIAYTVQAAQYVQTCPRVYIHSKKKKKKKNIFFDKRFTPGKHPFPQEKSTTERHPQRHSGPVSSNQVSALPTRPRAGLTLTTQAARTQTLISSHAPCTET
jgi:hypothetical protein